MSCSRSGVEARDWALYGWAAMGLGPLWAAVEAWWSGLSDCGGCCRLLDWFVENEGVAGRAMFGGGLAGLYDALLGRLVPVIWFIDCILGWLYAGFSVASGLWPYAPSKSDISPRARQRCPCPMSVSQNKLSRRLVDVGNLRRRCWATASPKS